MKNKITAEQILNDPKYREMSENDLQQLIAGDTNQVDYVYFMKNRILLNIVVFRHSQVSSVKAEY